MGSFIVLLCLLAFNQARNTDFYDKTSSKDCSRDVLPVKPEDFDKIKDCDLQVTEDEWWGVVASIQPNLSAVETYNQLYVMVKNIESSHRQQCVQDIQPLLQGYWTSLETDVTTCKEFVPVGNVQDLLECCDHQSQPIQSDMEAKMALLSNCV